MSQTADRSYDAVFIGAGHNSLASALHLAAKGWKVGLLANQSITGDLTHGLSLFGTANYGRLAGDFKRSPIVADRGSGHRFHLLDGQRAVRVRVVDRVGADGQRATRGLDHRLRAVHLVRAARVQMAAADLRRDPGDLALDEHG